MTDDRSTARSMLHQDAWLVPVGLVQSLWHQAPAEHLQAIVDAGKGDVPLKDALTSALRAGGAGGSYGECDPILGNFLAADGVCLTPRV